MVCSKPCGRVRRKQGGNERGFENDATRSGWRDRGRAGRANRTRRGEQRAPRKSEEASGGGKKEHGAKHGKHYVHRQRGPWDAGDLSLHREKRRRFDASLPPEHEVQGTVADHQATHVVSSV